MSWQKETNGKKRYIEWGTSVHVKWSKEIFWLNFISPLSMCFKLARVGFLFEERNKKTKQNTQSHKIPCICKSPCAKYLVRRSCRILYSPVVVSFCWNAVISLFTHFSVAFVFIFSVQKYGGFKYKVVKNPNRKTTTQTLETEFSFMFIKGEKWAHGQRMWNRIATARTFLHTFTTKYTYVPWMGESQIEYFHQYINI